VRTAVCAAIALQGCNWVYDLRTTELIDAAIYDAPIDAPFECPPIGTQPEFSPLVQQVIPRNCQYFTASPDLGTAAALCDDGTQDGRIETGPSAQELSPAVLSGAPAEFFTSVRLTPEGDELWVRRVSGTFAFVSVYTRVDDQTWLYARDLTAVGTAFDDRVSAPTRKVGGVRRFVQWTFNSFDLREFADDGVTTSLVHAYTAGDLDTNYVLYPNVSSDGLRLVFLGEPRMGPAIAVTMYADRATTDQLFSTAAPLRAAPVVLDPFLTEGCGKLYTSGLGSLFYAPQK